MRRLLALLSAGVLTLSLAPTALASAPTNDELAGATIVTLTADVPFVDVLDTTEATANPSDPMRPDPYGGWYGGQPVPIGPTVWYVYTATTTGMIGVDLTGSSYVPSLLMLRQDMTFMNLTSDVMWPDVVAGETYYFVIGDEIAADGLGGTLVLSVGLPAPEPVPVEAQIGVTGAEIVDGVLVVSGTLTATGEFWSSMMTVEAAQKGKPALAGVGFISDPGTEWTVSIDLGTTWQTARTSVTVQVLYWVDGDEFADWFFESVVSLRPVQAEPAPTPELGSVSGRFTFLDERTGEAIAVVVDLWHVSPLPGATPSGTLVIKSGRLAGTYAPYWMDFGTFAGSPQALLGIQLPEARQMAMSFSTIDAAGWVSISVADDGWTTMLDSADGPVVKKGFSITMPAT